MGGAPVAAGEAQPAIAQVGETTAADESPAAVQASSEAVEKEKNASEMEMAPTNQNEQV